MAMVDYGVVAIKNGKVINDGLFFMNMLTAVGWVDQKRIRHDDCDCFDDPDPLLAKSNCYYCNKAQKEIVQYENCEDTDAKLIADCHGESIEPVSNHIDGNYFAYVGDEHLTLAFYKQHCLIIIRQKKVMQPLKNGRQSKQHWAPVNLSPSPKNAGGRSHDHKLQAIVETPH